MAVQVERAAEAYQRGRHEECLGLLQQAGSSLAGFSREQWIVESNCLACKTQMALVAGDVGQLHQIHSQYRSLWERVRGLPPSLDSLPTELVVVCAIAQLEVCLRACSHTLHCCNTLIKRVCQHYGLQLYSLMEALPSLVPLLQREHGAFAVRCLLKLAFLTALLHLTSSAVPEGKMTLCALQQMLPETMEAEQTLPETMETKQTLPETMETKQTLPETMEAEQTLPETMEAEQTLPETMEAGQTLPETMEAEQTLPETMEVGVFDMVANVKISLDAMKTSLELPLEREYSKAWKLYAAGHYGEALSALDPLLQHPSLPPHTTSITRLLAAGCYTNLVTAYQTLERHKPHLALCSYRKCFTSPSHAAVPHSLHSCAAVYKRLGNIGAEMETRILLIELLNESQVLNDSVYCVQALTMKEGGEGGGEGGGEEGRPLEVLLWKNEEGVSFWPPQCGRVLEASYFTACRAMQLKRFKTAADLFTGITRRVEAGAKALPPSLPTASTLLLHTIQALLCSGEYNQADERCSQLVETLLPSVESMLAQQCKKEEEEEEGVRCMLVLSQAFCFRSSAAIELNQLTDAKSYCERCLKLVQWLQLRAGQLPEGMLQCTWKIQVHTLNTLAVMLVGEGKPGRALQLLGEAVCSPQCPPSTLLVYNHCLLQCRVGRVGEAAQSWLEQRDGGVPPRAQEARRRVGEARKRLPTLGPSQPEHHYVMMDIAMLNTWQRHCPRSK